MTPATWNGVFDPSTLKPAVLAKATLLADAARAGEWGVVLDVLSVDGAAARVNDWRPGGTTLYAPLHQAAWLGAPPDVVERLVGLGAWRTLRTATGQRALDIAMERGHGSLLDVLEPVVHRPVDPETLAALDGRLDALIESRIRPHITERLRHPACEVLTELPEGTLWYPVPGMYGGFNIELREHHLYVESWSRVVEGSGQAHVITAHACQLVRSGFV